jgi:hypothetical protein
MARVLSRYALGITPPQALDDEIESAITAAGPNFILFEFFEKKTYRT